MPVRDTFYLRCGKRVADCVVSGLAIVALAPIFAVAAVLVKFSSPGPILFRQLRVGKQGQLFKLLKFRSMRVATEDAGAQITAAHDSRVTSVGRLLRRSKLDELPQLWNVLKGDMSIVGPRPEVPRYVRLYTQEQQQVLSVRPGITDPASISFRHEESLLAQQADPEQFYIATLLGTKLQMNLQYVREISFFTDLKIVLQTIATVIRLHPDTRKMQDFQRL